MAVQKFPTPTTTEAVRQFLGLAGYYRSFVRDFAKKASPMFQLLKKDVPFQWGAEEDQAFHKFKEDLTNSPCLAYPDFSKRFILCTDASIQGLGAVLMQEDNRGKLQPIAYASRQLKAAENNYFVTDIEPLAVVWSLTSFKDFIYGYNIEVYTDHKPLTGLFKDRLLSGRRARWKCIIDNYNPSLHYLQGKLNATADA